MLLIHSKPLEKIGSQLPIFLTGFALVAGLAILLQQVGLPLSYMSQLMMVILLGTYFYSGISTATMSLDAFQNARRCISPYFNGQGLAAGMISMGIYVLLPGFIYTNGTGSLDYFSGWLLSVVLMTTVIASAYNKSKAATLPAFIVSREESRWQRFTIMLIVLAVSALLLLANFVLIADIGARLFSVKHEYAIAITCITIGSCLMLGGIQGMTMARIFSYVILLSALLVPLIWTSVIISGNLIPQFSFGEGAITPVLEIGRALIDNDLLHEEQNKTITSLLFDKGLLSFFATMLCIACGLSVMPHLVQHFVVVESPSIARRSGVWAFAFLLLVITAIPAIAAFAHFEIFSALISLEVVELREDFDWLYALSGNGNLPLISICGQLVSGFNDALSACGGSGQHILSAGDVKLDPEFLLLGTANLHNLPTIMIVLLGLGIMVALWSTADGLMLVMANTLSNDFYRNIFRPRSPVSVRLFMTRFLLVMVIGITAILASTLKLDKLLLMETGIALSAATLFPAVVISVWFRNFTETANIIIMINGFIVFTLLVFPIFYPPAIDFMWTGIEPFIAGLAGLIAASLTGFVIGLFSLITFKIKEHKHATASN